MVSLLSCDLVLKSTGSALQIVEDLLQDLVVTLSRLVILDLLSVGVNDAITGVLRRGDGRVSSTEGAPSNW